MPKVIVPEDLKCPITQEIFIDPVSTSDGHVYERAAIEKWLIEENKNTSPLTGLPLPNKTIIPNLFAKKMVNSFMENNKICKREDFIKMIEAEDIKNLSEANYFENYLDIKLTDDKPLIIYAASTNKVALGEWLLQEGVDIEEKYTNGSTALSFAAQAGDVEFLNLLIEKGANIEALTDNETDNENYTPLFWAINANKIESVKVLLSHKANLLAKGNSREWTPLHYAAHLGLREIVKFLLDNGAPYKALDNTQQTPSQVAIENEKDEIALFIDEYTQLLKKELKNMPSRVASLEKIVEDQLNLITIQQNDIEKIKIEKEDEIKDLKIKIEELTKKVSEISLLLNQAPTSNTNQSTLLSKFSPLYVNDDNKNYNETKNVDISITRVNNN